MGESNNTHNVPADPISHVKHFMSINGYIISDEPRIPFAWDAINHGQLVDLSTRAEQSRERPDYPGKGETIVDPSSHEEADDHSRHRYAHG